jgi:thiol-disulfide isomerase/thioredoxin
MFLLRFKSIFTTILLVLSSFFILTSLLNEKSGRITIVQNFAEIEHLFNNHNDTTYLINFWATTCPPCLKELPMFEKIAENRSDDKFRVILINIDDKKRIEKYVVPFLKKNNIQNEVFSLLDDNFNIWTARINAEWYGALPYTVIYRNSNKKYYFGAFKGVDDIEKEVAKMLNN